MSATGSDSSAVQPGSESRDVHLGDFNSTERKLGEQYKYPAYMQYAAVLADVDSDWNVLKDKDFGTVELPPDLYPTDEEIQSLPASSLMNAVFVGSDRARNLAIAGAIEVVGYHNDLINAATQVHNIATKLRRDAGASDNDSKMAPANDPLLIAFAEEYNINIERWESYTVEEWDIHIQSILLQQERMINDAKVSTYDVELYMGELATVVQISAKVLSAFGSAWRNIVQGLKLQ